MSFRGRGNRGGFRQNYRGSFNRGGINPNERPSPWKSQNERHDDKNESGGYRPGNFSQDGPYNDNRDLSSDNLSRDFAPNRDTSRLNVGGSNSRGPSSIDSNKWNDTTKNTSTTSAIAAAATQAITQNVLNNQRTNDVEIIVTHKSLTEYAEFIERRLKTCGLSVDLLFPNEEVPLGRVLANIASRGTLYALVVTQLSEQRRSVTVNVLYGQTQEHRNMPLDDALNLIVKIFEAYSKGEKFPIVPPFGAVPVTPAGIPLGDKHPEVIQNLLNILVENRPLTTFQYDKIIGYLQDRKNEMMKGDSKGSSDSLKNRIYNLLASTDTKVLPPTQNPNPSVLRESSTVKMIQNLVQHNVLNSLGVRM